MNTLEILKQAINRRKTIYFEYNKKGEISKRICHPYVVYLYVAKSGNKISTKVAVVQIDGDSDSKDKKPFPSFRDFLSIEDILNVQIYEELESFGPPYHEHYNPESERYKNPIAKL